MLLRLLMRVRLCFGRSCCSVFCPIVQPTPITGQSIAHYIYTPKWLASNIWIRDVFLTILIGSQHLYCRGSQPNHVWNPVYKSLPPLLIDDTAFSGLVWSPATCRWPVRHNLLDLGYAPYVLYGVNYIDLVSLQPAHGQPVTNHNSLLLPFFKIRRSQNLNVDVFLLSDLSHLWCRGSQPKHLSTRPRL